MSKLKEFKVHSWINPEEAATLISDCPKPRDKLILRTMWETGGRVSEVLSLIPRYVEDDTEGMSKKCTSISLVNLKQNAIRKGDNETDSEYEGRKVELKEWKEKRATVVRDKKGPFIDKYSPPLNYHHS